jgi:HK97 family phage prohead protease
VNDTERRFTRGLVEVRGDTQRSIGGYAAKFNKLSQNLGGFVERINPAFFNKSAADGFPDVMARYNHDDNMLLGTTAGRTLRLAVDDTGLDYTVDPPSHRGDVLELITRGDVRQSSFAFRLGNEGDDWGMTEQGFPMRTLLSGQLVDVAPVNSPAYLDTSTGLRSLAARLDVDPADVEDAAREGELRKFFGRPAPTVVDLGGEARASVSDKPWSDFSAADYTPQQWRSACLIDTGDGAEDSKDRYKLPVREPGGMLNRAGCHAAASALAGGRGGVQASPEQKKAAAKKLAALYRSQLKEDPPQSLVDLATRSAEADTETSATTGQGDTHPVLALRLRHAALMEKRRSPLEQGDTHSAPSTKNDRTE